MTSQLVYNTPLNSACVDVDIQQYGKPRTSFYGKCIAGIAIDEEQIVVVGTLCNREQSVVISVQSSIVGSGTRARENRNLSAKLIVSKRGVCPLKFYVVGTIIQSVGVELVTPSVVTATAVAVTQ